MSDSVLINGKLFAWPSAKLKVAGEEFTGITAIKFGHALNSALAYGMGRAHAPRGRTGGKYEPEPIVLTMFVDSMVALQSRIAKLSKSGKSYGAPIFQMSLSFVEEGLDPVFVEFVDCKYQKESGSTEETAEATKYDVEIQPMRIKINGLYLFDDGGQAS